MARKNRVRNGRAEQELRKKKAAERQAEWDSLTAGEKMDRQAENFEKYKGQTRR